MSRAAKREEAEAKRRDLAVWMYDELVAHMSRGHKFNESWVWLDRRVQDKMKDEPQNKQLILGAVKYFQDTLKKHFDKEIKPNG